LRQHLGSNRRVVAGAIGALGYYSMPLYIYDQNGLVNREVARRDRSADEETLRWPGHDAYVEKDFFVDRTPAVLDYEVVHPPNTDLKLKKIGARWREENRKQFYPEVVPFTVKGRPNKTSYLLLQRHGKVDKAKKGWEKFHEKFGLPTSKPKPIRGRKKPRANAQFKPQDPDAVPSGRWRTFTDDATLSAEQRRELEMLELIGYVSGSVEASEKPVIGRYDAQRSQPGVNLVASGHGAEAFLMDMDGTILHTWQADFDDVWPDYPIEKSHESRGYWRRVHMLPNGDLLAIFEGLGILRVSRTGEVMWAKPNRAHHDIHVTDQGDIYTLTRVARTVPRLTKEHPILEDFITVLDGETGDEKASVSVLEAFEASDFDDVWRSDFEKRDIFHTNSIEVLDGVASGKDPAFAAGNVLISMRNINAVAVVDLSAGETVWAWAGDFALQHDAKVLPNGNLMVFDNGESPPSSAAEYELPGKRLVWSFEGTTEEPFYTPSCGIAERLANGNTLMVESDPGRAIEVTPAGDVVWEFHNPHRAGPNNEFIASVFQVMRVERPRWVKPSASPNAP
jgi:hypothetical protein